MPAANPPTRPVRPRAEDQRLCTDERVDNSSEARVVAMTNLIQDGLHRKDRVRLILYIAANNQLLVSKINRRLQLE